MKCSKYNQEINESEWINIPELGIEVEIEVHDKGKSYNELNLKDKEDKLLTAEQCIFLANSKYSKILKMDSSSSTDDFYIKQPFNLNKKNNYVAWFVADSVRAILYCDGDPSNTGASLGVRFARNKGGKK